GVRDRGAAGWRAAGATGNGGEVVEDNERNLARTIFGGRRGAGPTCFTRTRRWGETGRAAPPTLAFFCLSPACASRCWAAPPGTDCGCVRRGASVTVGWPASPRSLAAPGPTSALAVPTRNADGPRTRPVPSSECGRLPRPFRPTGNAARSLPAGP